jgi:cobalt-precorrin 5A hydrolase
MKQYILGIGCRRHINCSEIENAVKSVLDVYNIDLKSICKIVSCDLKADEKGLLEFAAKWKLPIRFFSIKELESVSVPNPSAKVIEKIGTPSVCEAAAKFAGNGVLLVEKQKFGNITVAVGESVA